MVTVAMKARRAPVGGAGFFGALTDCVKQYLAIATWRDPVFQHYYPFFCQDNNTLTDMSFGTPEHMKLVFAAVQNQEHRESVGSLPSTRVGFNSFRHTGRALPRCGRASR